MIETFMKRVAAERDTVRVEMTELASDAGEGHGESTKCGSRGSSIGASERRVWSIK